MGIAPSLQGFGRLHQLVRAASAGLGEHAQGQLGAEHAVAGGIGLHGVQEPFHRHSGLQGRQRRRPHMLGRKPQPGFLEQAAQIAASHAGGAQQRVSPLDRFASGRPLDVAG